MFAASVRSVTRPIMSASVRSFHASPRAAAINASNCNPLLANVQYAVRGEIVIKAGELEKKLKNGEKLPFDDVIYCNIGNPQQLLQKPISYLREVLALVELPALLEKTETRSYFKSDVIKRAEAYLKHLNINGTGPYCHSQGVELVREEVANFITARDGFAANPNDIYLTNGASAGVDMLLKMVIRGPEDGIMIPIPQYPLYSATIPMYDGSYIPYYLTEESGWSLSADDLHRSFQEAKKNGVTPRAVVVINPGNPTGQCLSKSDMEGIVDFCYSEDVALMADEVYQENVYGSTPFHSFRQVVFQKGLQHKIQMVSFHSVSKGFLGECGKRGGYFELMGFDEETRALLYKVASISLCSNVTGQLVVGLMTNPPAKSDESYPQYEKEKNAILTSLKRRAEKLVTCLNNLEGVSCQPANGAMYAFPSITIPEKAQKAAKELGKAPDMLYCLELLENTGICVVPGSGFKQKDGTFHFRTTFLPAEEQIDKVNERLGNFHKKFMDKYR